MGSSPTPRTRRQSLSSAFFRAGSEYSTTPPNLPFRRGGLVFTQKGLRLGSAFFRAGSESVTHPLNLPPARGPAKLLKACALAEAFSCEGVPLKTALRIVCGACVYLLDFRLLQKRQSIWQFSVVVFPPSHHGVMWSASIFSNSNHSPHLGQTPFWRV